MRAQYLAGRSSRSLKVEAFPPQTRAAGFPGYVPALRSAILHLGCTQVTITSYDRGKAIVAEALNSKRDRRIQCRTVLRAFSRSASWRSLLHVAAAVKLRKNSWLFNPNPSRLNRPTPANSSKPCDFGERAFAPARIPALALLFQPHRGGASC